MQGRRGGPPRIAAEPKAPAGRRDNDINRERLVYCLTSLVGHRCTAKLRNNVIYEGVFHSCSLDGDFSITLKFARSLHSGNSSGGEAVIRTLVIPGKDFLQVSAVDVPPPMVPEASRGPGFATDGEIAEKKGHIVRERELVPWASGEGAPLESGGGLDDDRGSGSQHWDQFKRNEEMYGITTTFNEDLYTTKLDPDSIPKAKREEAERIAREIEGGRMASEVEGRLEDAEDEEGMFSSVHAGGAGSSYRRKDGLRNDHLALARSSSGRMSGKAIPQVPLTEEHLTQHDSLSGIPGDYAREHRTKRGMITAHSPMRTPMVSEMKRINALNLEPALPKLDDKTRNDWINFKQLQTKNRCPDLKMEFQASLEAIRKRDAERKHVQQRTPATADTVAVSSAAAAGPSSSTEMQRRPKPAALAVTGESGQSSANGASGSGQPGPQASPAASPSQGRWNDLSPTMTGADSTRSNKFTFNASAKEFSFNPSASAFTPTNASKSAAGAIGGAGPSAQQQAQSQSQSQVVQTTSGPQPQFMAHKTNELLLSRGLNQILDQLFDHAVKEPVGCSGEWPGANGPTFREILGQPSAANPMPPVGPMSPGAAPSTGWQQQAPGGPGVAPQMMGQGAYMVAAPSAPGGQQQAQMYPAQMYPTGPQGAPAPRPPNGQGGNMQPMVFNQQQTMMQPPQSMAIPGGMVNQGGQSPGMGNMAKFGQAHALRSWPSFHQS